MTKDHQRTHGAVPSCQSDQLSRPHKAGFAAVLRQHNNTHNLGSCVAKHMRAAAKHLSRLALLAAPPLSSLGDGTTLPLALTFAADMAGGRASAAGLSAAGAPGVVASASAAADAGCGVARDAADFAALRRLWRLPLSCSCGNRVVSAIRHVMQVDAGSHQ